MADDMCTVDGCDKPRKYRELCGQHYNHWRRSSPDRPRCIEDGCESAAMARKLCDAHYALWRRHRADGMPCSVDGCQVAAYGHGYCQKHYERWRSNGDPLVSQRFEGTELERFEHYRPRLGADECWPWEGTITHEGYGVFGKAGRIQVKAHRYAWELDRGPLDPALTIDHLCHTNHPTCQAVDDCPHRRCCNPAHMEPVTFAENSRRANEGRGGQATHCKQGHEFTEANTYVYGNARKCRQCHKECEQRRRDAAKAA